MTRRLSMQIMGLGAEVAQATSRHLTLGPGPKSSPECTSEMRLGPGMGRYGVPPNFPQRAKGAGAECSITEGQGGGDPRRPP